jgi:hypothetical protein
MIEQAKRVAKATGTSSGEALKVAVGAQPDPADLRGIPCIARGISGTSPGTRPGAKYDREDAA